MDRPLVAVVMAGGTGTRLYPAARAHRPKQFLSFGGERSLLAETVARVEFADSVVVSTRSAFAEQVIEHAPGADVVVEPEAKDTGPALVDAARSFAGREVEPVLLCLPADHVIEGAFEPTAREAARLAAATGDLVTIGVEPDRPATGYGYLVPGEPRGDGGFAVEEFVEKPAEPRARSLVADGALWNAGMFAWTPGALLREVRESPLSGFTEALEAGDRTAGYGAVEPVSIDRAVLERSDRVAAVAAGFEWDDLGSWDAVARVVDEPLAESLEVDAGGNVLASDGAHITVVGASDLVVAAYDDRVLVVPADRAQAVREAVSRLEEQALF